MRYFLGGRGVREGFLLQHGYVREKASLEEGGKLRIDLDHRTCPSLLSFFLLPRLVTMDRGRTSWNHLGGCLTITRESLNIPIAQHRLHRCVLPVRTAHLLADGCAVDRRM